ncbi:MAG TPA: 50S ribosomal protein L4 [Candidatus Paceibacterota bacterium]|nr:50S ribosomal protein L4 [Candidatus Paceibacterota bacterium]
MDAPIYTAEGKKKGSVSLPESVFGLKWNDALMHQVVTSMHDNARTNVAHTKDRGEVRGGGKKPWAQKGTGRARHGSSRSPIWVGGGVAHGPRNTKVFARAIPRSMRSKALAVALSQKLRDGEIIFVDSLGLSTPKTATAKKALSALAAVGGFEKLGTKTKNTALVALTQKNDAAEKSFRNLGHIACMSIVNLNPAAVLRSTFLIVENPQEAVAMLESRLVKRPAAAAETK